MKRYEGIFIFKPDLNKEGLDKALNHVQEIIKKHKGSVDQMNDWGKQRLAYPLRKHREGFYYLINFYIDADSIDKLKKAVTLNESILRALITKT